MIREEKGVFVLDTEHTTYAFRIMESGHPEHLYYGRKLHVCPEAMQEKHTFAPGTTSLYSAQFKNFSPEDVAFEMSSVGKGDLREPFIEMIHKDGSRTSDFLYERYEIGTGVIAKRSLPGAVDDHEEAMYLRIFLRDAQYQQELELRYTVFPSCDVITRSAVLVNQSEEEVRLERLMSLQLDFERADYVCSSFHGAWAREMNRFDTALAAGRFVVESTTGNSSNKANPFVMLAKQGTTEEQGECYGFNLIYSGNHYESFEVSSFGKLRLLTGIQPATFSWLLGAGDSFESPEAVMTYASAGYNAMSRHMHAFVRQHIIRGIWKDRHRPILLNSWEAAYFKISEKKLLKLAKAAKNVGIELLVMDDGWFGERDDDTSSLGDWVENSKKLPGGLRGIVEKVNTLGLDFGIWIEPEMVSVRSRLYAAHPEWVLQIPEKPHSEGRNQRILDMGNVKVQEYVIKEMSRVLGSANISYVKWDMNRQFSDYFSQALEASRQGEVSHRYICGLYRCMKELTEKFPNVLFEGCASGGNRFDLGILCYFPQIWGSDNTDALCRAKMLNSYSYGYPQETVTAHVSDCPNHQTLRCTPLETRFAAAAFGNLGYECNLCDMTKEERNAIKEQISLYKAWREVLQKGTFYRGRSFGNAAASETNRFLGASGDVMEWCIVAEDQSKAVGFLMQELTEPNTQYQYFKASGLKPDEKYHFYNRAQKYDIRNFGSLVNMFSPIHLKPNSVVQNMAAKVVKMDGETEDYVVYGDTLMYSGVKLKQGFGATGYNEQIRYFQDFSARMYFMEIYI